MSPRDNPYDFKVSLPAKRLYLIRRVEDVRDLKTALVNLDYDTIINIGHRIKGSARLFDFVVAEELASLLEAAAESRDSDRLASLVAEFETCIEGLKNGIFY